MRIVIDLQGAQSESRFRGIGRYSIAFAQGVARNLGDHELVICLNGLLRESIPSLRAAFRNLLPERNIVVWDAPGPLRHRADAQRAANLVRESFLASLRPDVVHVSSLFEGFVDDTVTGVGQLGQAVPVTAVLYDLIPLLNPKQYLDPHPDYRAYYLQKVNDLQKAALLFAISGYAAEEGASHLAVPRENIINVSSAVDPCFRPLPVDAVRAAALRKRFGIDQEFAMYAGSADERKNLPRLIEAWALLPEALRNRNQLLLAGRILPDDAAMLARKAAACGLPERALRFTGYIDDDELVALYNLCAVFVFPSWHEGFGLPVLEAMACGAPVICADTTSPPEIIGTPEALFDPFDTQSITARLGQALTDSQLRDRLRAIGLQRAPIFSWDETARRAIAAWESLASDRHSDATSWSSLPATQEAELDRLIDALACSLKPPPQREALNALAISLERNERAIADFHRPGTLPARIAWRVEGPFDSSYSLALVNREFARALAALGHDVTVHSTEGTGDFSPDPAFLVANPDLHLMHQRATITTAADADVSSRNLFPPRVDNMGSRANLMHCFAWEESGFPEAWAHAFNQHLQGLLVTSKHVRKVLLDAGVTVPVLVCGNGTDHWQRVEAASRLEVELAPGFRFLHVSSCFPRKGVDVLLRAYGRAFRASDDVTLVIKTFANPHNDIQLWLAQARDGDPSFPRVMVIEQDLDETQLKALYLQCNALVAPSRAEGFGLPMAEAMLAGLPVITTAWGGQTDFCTPQTAWLIDFEFQRARSHFGLFASVWAEPDEAHLACLMREVWLTPEAQRLQRSGVGRTLLLERFSWSHAAGRAVAAARVLAKAGPRPQPRIGVVTTWKVRCGIAEYTRHLLGDMPNDVFVLAARTADSTIVDEARVSRCWSPGDDDGLQQLSFTVEGLDLDVLLIEFNYGFFGFAKLRRFLQQQIAAGRKVVLQLHSTSDPEGMPHKRLSLLCKVLKECHCVLVHTPLDMNRLKRLGVIDNVALFPHGVVDASSLGISGEAVFSKSAKQEWLLASYGFALPHKGLEELLEAFALLRAQGLPLRLRMVNAEYPIDASRQLLDRLRARVNVLGLDAHVEICSDYLDDADSLQRLQAADLIIFPYQKTGESSSAAVRFGVASGKPVAVTPAPIFEDVLPAVFSLPGASVTEIVGGLQTVLEQLRSDSPAAHEQAENAGKWRHQHAFPALSRRLYGILYALHAPVVTD